ncbi:hypothetical protein N9E48_01735 [Paracoccaceae bacterium]|nr:hypothetical protein [Paracoccaceae bacterium]
MISLPSFKADFRSASVTNISAGQLSLRTPKFVVEEDFASSEIIFSSSVDLSSLRLRDVMFTVQNASILDEQNEHIVSVDMIVGRLAKISLGQDWRIQPLELEISAETAKLESDRFKKINIHSFSLKAQNDGSVVNAVLTADTLLTEKNGFYLKGIRVQPSIDLISLRFSKEILIQIAEGRFERTKANKISGNIKALEAVMGLHLPERFLEGVSNITDLEIWNKQLPLITIPELELGISGSISEIDKIQQASAKFKALIKRESETSLIGDVTSQFSNAGGQDCLMETCVLSDVLLNLKYEFEGEQATGQGSCSSDKCLEKIFALTVETSNTPKIVMGLKKQKILNPLALVLFAGALMQGQETGFGHKVEF